MATLVFGTLGSLVGGPVGGALGALLGREVDRRIAGTPLREGPRLKELAVSGSSYGQPIARQFGAMRAAGTIIWATDLAETGETAGGGKGQPKTTRYSYAVSLAVALSSRPILGVRRIWADGNLLRGAAGDLKTGGTLRVHSGHADQEPDPLLAAALGAQCPAHRGLAYAVFEDLQLADFGNRIPALSFEVLADGAGVELVRALCADAPVPLAAAAIPEAALVSGFAHEGGSLGEVLAMLGEALPLAADAGGAELALGPLAAPGAPVPLPPKIAWPDGDFGARTGAQHARGEAAGPTGLRYYDTARDFQPGFQRATGRAPLAGERVLELPAALSAAGAGALIDAARRHAAAGAERLLLRVAALDRAIAPSALVRVPGQGLWRVAGWEWRSAGVELELVRHREPIAGDIAADAGAAWRPADRLPAATILAAFELPWDGAGAADAVRIHAAVGAGAGRWAGAALHAERAGALVPLGPAGPPRAVTGTLTAPLPPSPALLFEADAAIELRCDDPDAVLTDADLAGLAAGANRLLIGEEIVQFALAQPRGEGRWRLAGLLRGRGAGEAEALAGHAAGTRVVLLDERLRLIDGAGFDPATQRLAAIGLGDVEPVFARVAAPGRSRQPLPPVHPIAAIGPTGDWSFGWTRRARGAWGWADGVETPLVEESERYEIGAGPPAAPLRLWTSAAAALTVPAAELAGLASGTQLWVRQLGSHAPSRAVRLHTLA